MGKGIELWFQKETKEKVLYVIGGICAISIIVLTGMQFLGIFEDTINLIKIMLGVLMMIQAIQNWKKNRKVSIISLCASMLIFGVMIMGL